MRNKTLFEVFPNVQFSGKYKEIKVSKVNFDEKNKAITIKCNSSIKMEEKDRQHLEKKILEKLDYLKEVNVEITFISNDSPEEVIDKYFRNVIDMFKGSSTFTYTILKKSKYYIRGNSLLIEVNEDLYFYVIGKEIDKSINSILKREYNLAINVSFEIVKEGMTTENYKKNKDEELKSMISSLALNDRDKPKKEENNKERKKSKKNRKYKTRRKNGVNYVGKISGEICAILDGIVQDDETIIKGEIFELEVKEIKNGKLLISFDMFDESSAVTVKFFITKEIYEEEFKGKLYKGDEVIVKGYVRYDTYDKELNIMANEICQVENKIEEEKDEEEIKRVELHLHTNMSSMDGINSIKDYIKKAKKYGHKSLAITDHGVVQAFPEAMNEVRDIDFKLIYGVEAYLINDIELVVGNVRNQNIEDEFVVFDIETTGLYSNTNKIIEIGAVKIKNMEIIDTFSVLINPNEMLSDKIIKLTGITDNMLEEKGDIESEIDKFIDFIGKSILVGHNVKFDIGFLNKAVKDVKGEELENTFIDTVTLCQGIFNGNDKFKNFKLDTIARNLGISLKTHHRALEDAKATGKILIHCLKVLEKDGITRIEHINEYIAKKIDYKKIRPNHCIILVKNLKGLKNLYKLISESHINNYYRNPRIPKSLLVENKEGLIIGSACEAGELYKNIIGNMPKSYIKKISQLYNYFEIQPLENNKYLIKNGAVTDIRLIEINREIVKLGDVENKIVVGTGDVHFLNKADKVYREILMSSKGFKDAEDQPPLYYKSTKEMLNNFSYLGEKKAYEIVVTNTNKISDLVEKINPIPDGTFPPKIEGADKELEKIAYEKARSLYGDDLPKVVEERLNRELTSIISNGFAVMYIIAEKLVKDSEKAGYLVGSRGSVGSSFAATMSGITEVNPLPPHYYCKKCQYNDFDSELVLSFAGGTGYDMPDKNCPSCGTKLTKEGHDIPFETFLGFDGDKEPDIDLNFSGDYQGKAHEYTEKLFGKGYVYKAGTIGTLANKTAFGIVSGYYNDRGEKKRKAEISKLKNGCIGVKRTTGQHPGGLMVVPNNYSIYDFSPIQRPANDESSGTITTHFDYNAISGRLLKLDILGHDNPTIVKMLLDNTGLDCRDIDLGDKDVISLFRSPEALGVTKEEIDCNTGSLGLPEFGTSFVRQMLEETKPNSFSELVRISGLSHGTDVWTNNGQELVKSGVATLKEIIPTRDDIMVYLIQKGLDKLKAFKIMENVRKGKGLTEEEENLMVDKDVPTWYIESCKKIKYMFPKGHAVAYVMMTVRIAYYKIHYPYAFYQAIFTVKGNDFDYKMMCEGIEKVKSLAKEINDKGRSKTQKDAGTLVLLELCQEFYSRGLKFKKVDIYKSSNKKFIITKEGLLPPLSSIQGLGGNAGENVVNARKDGKFTTIEDFAQRTKVNKTVIEILKTINIFDGLAEKNQLSLLDI